MKTVSSYKLLIKSLLFCLLLPGIATAELLSRSEDTDLLFLQVYEALSIRNIDVLPNLNHRELARDRLQRPRLGRFPDLPVGLFPGSEEIINWEQAYVDGQIGALVVLANSEATGSAADELWLPWLDAGNPSRVFVTFASADQGYATDMAEVFNSYGHSAVVILDAEDIELAGHFYATAAKRWALDSAASRDLKTELTELNLLGERLRRNTDSVYRDGVNRADRSLARQEPAVFLKESLGDEFSDSTVREIIVPGGVALGESATSAVDAKIMRFVEGRIQLGSESGEFVSLPILPAAELKALFDFVERSTTIASDAIVDIDADGRVKISAALRDTDVGFEIMQADIVPFEYVRNLRVSKSVIVDTDVDWYAVGDMLAFETDFEVRFLSADNMRLAQTRVALEYAYQSQSQAVAYTGYWGPDAGQLRENLDYDGLGKELGQLAKYAGWIALFRTLQETQVSFLHGRYEFMKIDKSGQKTPGRY